MKHGILVAGAAALAISTPALADVPMPLHGVIAPTTEVAQAQAPVYPPAPPPTVLAPTAPPAPQAEIPPPAPSRSYVWEPGHWSWNGVQYFWEPGKYVERPTVAATYVGGHWEQHPNGWVWVEGRWDYSGSGSSTPPAR